MDRQLTMGLGTINVYKHDSHDFVMQEKSDGLQDALKYCLDNHLEHLTYAVQDDGEGFAMDVNMQEVADLYEAGERPQDLSFF